MQQYPDLLEIRPLAQPVNAVPQLPGSKSITNRALVLAALAGRGRGCELRGLLRSEDTEVMLDALRQLGFQVHLRQSEPWPGASAEAVASRLTYQPHWIAQVGSPANADVIPAPAADLFVANSGTTMR